VWWSTPVIPTLGRWRQVDGEFEAILCYIALVWNHLQVVTRIPRTLRAPFQYSLNP
jgi:hypothetical protein